MQINNFVKQFEGCRLESYQDSGGVWTLGYGHIGVREGDTCTQEQADAWLDEDIAKAQQYVDSLVTAPLNDNQNIALVDFTYNLGAGSLEKSTLLKLLNENDFAGAADQFGRWCYAGAEKVEGLLRRRLAERDLFLS